MARILSEGFEWGNTADLVMNGVEFNTSVVRSGAYSARMAQNADYIQFIFPAGITEFYLRAAVYQSSYGKEWQIYGDAGLVAKINFSNNRLTAYIGTTQIGNTGTGSNPPNQWNLVEVHYKMADSGGVFQIKIEGILLLDWSGDSNPNTSTQISHTWFPGGDASALYLDDMAINDTSGTEQNSWPGDGHILMFDANGNGDSSQLVGSDGNSTDNYLLVDETPPDGDTTYVVGSTAGQKDLYNVENHNLPSNAVLTLLWGEVLARAEAAGAGDIKVLVKSGATTHASPARTPTTTYGLFRTDYLTKDPSDNQAWSFNDLDNVQVGVEIQ